MAYAAQTKAEFGDVLKQFPKVTEDPIMFEDLTVIQTYWSDFSDLYQLVHILTAEGQTKRWMKPAQWEHPERDWEKQMPKFWQSARTR